MKYSEISSSFYIKGRIGWKGLKKKEYLEKSNYRIINGKNITDGQIDWNSCGYISKERYDESPEISLKNDDILITKDGTIGKVGMVQNLDIPSTIASGIFILRNDDKKEWDTLFLFYYLQSNKFKEFIHSRVEGSVIPHLYQKDFEKMKVPEMPLKTQKSISKKIYSIQKKIDLNKKINDNLDDLMTTIFKHFVIESDHAKKSSLSKIADFVNGLAMKKYKVSSKNNSLPVVKIRELKQGFTNDHSDLCSNKIPEEHIINTGDIVFAWSASLIVKIWSGGKSGLNQHLFKVTSDNYPKWFIYEWTKYYIKKFRAIAADKATTMGHIKRSDLNEATVNVPMEKELKKLGKIISPIFDKYVENIQENNALNEMKKQLINKFFN